jgi:hypothetical protein
VQYRSEMNYQDAAPRSSDVPIGFLVANAFLPSFILFAFLVMPKLFLNTAMHVRSEGNWNANATLSYF